MASWKKDLRGVDFSLRLLALFLAVVLWFVATERPQRSLGLDERRVTVEITTDNLGDGIEIAQAPETADVTLEGPRLVLPFQVNEAVASIDLAGLGSGWHTVPVQVELPTGITLKQVQPQEVRVLLEPRVRRRIPVSVSVHSVPPGAAVQVGAVSPQSAEVFGASSAVASVRSLVAQVSYSSEHTQAEVIPVDESGAPVHGVAVSPRVIDVTIER